MKVSPIARALVAAGGLAIFAPSLSLGFLLLSGAVVCVGLALTLRKRRILQFGWFAIGMAVLGLQLAGVLAGSVATLFLSITLLVAFFPKTLSSALCLIFFATPLFQGLGLMAGDSLPPILAPAAPAVLAALVLCFSLGRFRIVCGAIIPSIFALAWLSSAMGLDPISISIICALPLALGLAVLLDASQHLPTKRFTAVGVLILAHLLFLIGISSPIRQDLYVWLPNSPDSYEAQFFKNYAATFGVIGIRISQISSSSAVPENATVLCPWTTEPQIGEFLDGIRRLPYAKTLRVILAGEHTNYRGVLDILNPRLRYVRLNNDTTVPPANRDYMGAVWTGDLSQFPPGAILNRGASISLTSPLSVPLLTAQSIFSDPGPKEIEPLWVGDYRQMSEDRRGWTLLAAAFRDGPLWTVIGDNSFLLNHLIAASPEPLFNLLALASLWPTIFLELFLLIAAALLSVVAYRSLKPETSADADVTASFRIFTGFALYGIFFGFSQFLNHSYHTGILYESLRPAWNGFDERSEAQSIVELAPDMDGNVRVFTSKRDYLQEKDIGQTGRTELHLGLIEDTFRYGAVSLKNCGRVGGMSLPEAGVKLMDAQFCAIEGDVRILLGTREQAIAFAIDGPTTVYFILDKYFLSGRSPNAQNVEFVRTILKGKRDLGSSGNGLN